MLTLPRPRINDNKIFDEVIAAKQEPVRSRLTEVRPSVRAAYRRYKAAAPEVAGLQSPALTQDQTGALHHAFEGATIPLRDVRDRILTDEAIARCPYCGINEARTLDHYLPKEDHPEFSILSKNLVPSCGDCNNRKRRLIVDEETNVRQFLHPYFDPVPAVSFLALKIRINARTMRLRFEIDRPDGMSIQSHAQILNHFRLLGLAERYRIRSLNELRGERRSLQRYFDDGGAARVSEELDHRAVGFQDVFGPNHWRTILFRALSRHARFCNRGFEVIPA